MTISFNTIPSNLRVPLFYAEMDASQANSGAQQSNRTLLIGQKLSAGVAAPNLPVLVASVDDAKKLFGVGSMLARMVAAYRASDPWGEIWAVPVPDAGAGVAATGTLTVSGPATAAGTLNLYVAGQRVQVAVANADTATAVAANIATALNAVADLPVTAAASAAVVTLTARWKGATGNDIQVTDTWGGYNAGESMPAGLAIAYAGWANGASNPALATAIAALGDDAYDYIVLPYADSTSLDAIGAELNDVSGRWSPLRKIYGHAYSAQRGSVSSLTTFGATRNDQHVSVYGFEADIQAPVWEVAAAYAGANAVGLNVDPARPAQTLPMPAIAPARPGMRFGIANRQSLLMSGIATATVAGGVLRVDRAITTWQRNSLGQPDDSYLDSETLHLSAAVLRRLASVITSKYPRHKLANDGTRYGAGQAIVTPAVIRGELVGLYYAMEQDGWVENADAFRDNLIVERNATNPSRLDVLFPPDYVNGLRIVAVLNQFRLQYPATVAA